VIGSIRATFKNDARKRTSLDINELIGEALALTRGDLQRYRISVQTEPNAQLPQVRGDRIQLQQVLLNLITNAIDSMAAKDGARVLRVRSESSTTAAASSYRWRILEPVSARKSSSGYSIRCSPQNPAVWGWVCRSAVRSSRPMKAGCGLPRTSPRAPSFGLRCSQTAPHLLERYRERNPTISPWFAPLKALASPKDRERRGAFPAVRSAPGPTTAACGGPSGRQSAIAELSRLSVRAFGPPEARSRTGVDL
jgi:hypothetical protein